MCSHPFLCNLITCCFLICFNQVTQLCVPCYFPPSSSNTYNLWGTVENENVGACLKSRTKVPSQALKCNFSFFLWPHSQMCHDVFNWLFNVIPSTAQLNILITNMYFYYSFLCCTMRVLHADIGTLNLFTESLK